MKRKDVYEVHNDDDVFDFTLSSPALKIRRLDAEMAPPIIDQDETMNPLLFEQLNGSSPIAVDELVSSSVPEENEERAIVLFNPNNDPHLLHLPRPLSISADSDFLSGFKNPILWSNESNTYRSLVDETQKQDDNSGQSNGSLAVVPWVPSHSQHPPNLQVTDPGVQISDMMDTDAMDVEDDCNSQHIPKTEWSVSQGLNPWQHHCMIQQPHINLSTPITWFGRGA